jgi:hypothetical protein
MHDADRVAAADVGGHSVIGAATEVFCSRLWPDGSVPLTLAPFMEAVLHHGLY